MTVGCRGLICIRLRLNFDLHYLCLYFFALMCAPATPQAAGLMQRKYNFWRNHSISFDDTDIK